MDINDKLETVPTGIDRIDADLNARVALINNMNIENKLPNHRLISNNFETEQKNQLIVDNEMRHEAGQLMKTENKKLSQM